MKNHCIIFKKRDILFKTQVKIKVALCSADIVIIKKCSKWTDFFWLVWTIVDNSWYNLFIDWLFNIVQCPERRF